MLIQIYMLAVMCRQSTEMHMTAFHQLSYYDCATSFLNLDTNQIK
jgi:hypothetical protein